MNINFTEEYLAKEILSIKYLYTHREGLYFFYNLQDELLYIGWANSLSARIRQHLNGKTNTNYFSKEIYKVKILSSDDFYYINSKYLECQDIEYFLIDKLNPKYNKVRSKRLAYIS